MRTTTKRLRSAALVCFAALLAACDGGQQRSEARLQERDSLLHVIAQRDEEVNSMIGTLNDIQEGFRRISEAEGRITIAQSGPEGTSSYEIMRDNINYIQEAMLRNRNMIGQLEAKLKASTMRSEAMEEAIKRIKVEYDKKRALIQELQAQIAERDSVIAEQTEQIEALNLNVGELTAENKQKTAALQAQDKELNKGWFVFGTKAELREQKIVNGDGVLRSGEMNRSYFTEVDTRTMNEIRLYSKKAELLTSHPDGSYALRKDQSGEYMLQIRDQKKFWSVSKYLVIMVK